MANLDLSKFFNTEFVNYASYDNTRKIASYIDGLKSGSRKVAFTLLEKKIDEPLKVSQLSSKVAEFAEYLHGSLDGVIVTLGQDYCGTNNVPLIQKKGNFGTRFTPEAAASRYIFGCGSKHFFDMFLASDSNVLEKQQLEGIDIEPKFYTPSLPVILINGSEGVSSGFAQKILPRNPNNIKKAVVEYIKHGKINQDLLIPWFNGFNGEVVPGDAPKQYLIKGVLKKIALNKVQIDELPIGYDLKGYIKVLEDLSDAGVINDYTDLSDSSFKFIVTFPKGVVTSSSEDELMVKLKLVKKVTENYTCMTEHNNVAEFNTPEEILVNFIRIKLLYLQKRKDFTVKHMEETLAVLSEKIRFLKLVISNTLKVAKKPLAEIEASLAEHNFLKVNGSWDYLLSLKLWNLTEEHLNKLQDVATSKATELEQYKTITLNDLWLNDIKTLKF